MSEAEPRRCVCVADGAPCYEREGRPFAFDNQGLCPPCQNNHQGYLRTTSADALNGGSEGGSSDPTI